MTSELRSVIAKLRSGRQLSPQAIDELDRLLVLLRSQGWSGFIPADEALAALIEHHKLTA